MPRVPIFSGWSIDVPSDFGREDTEDGFVIFRREGHTIWTTAYVVEYQAPRDALADVAEGFFDSPPDFPPEDMGEQMIGCAWRFTDTLEKGGFGLATLSAISKRVAKIDFEFRCEDDYSLAMEIWRSCRHDGSELER